MRWDGRIASRTVLVMIDLSDGTVSLSQPDEFTRFSKHLKNNKILTLVGKTPIGIQI